LRLNLAKQSAYSDGVQYTIRLPLLKNPSIANIALRYNISLIQYPSGSSYGVLINHYEIINDYYTQADTSTSFTSSIGNTNRNVQMNSGVDLMINLNQNLAQWNSATFKLDNSQVGLISSFSICTDTINYNYYYFHTFNMVLAQKKSTTNISTVAINSNSGTNNYQSSFGFTWVRIFNTWFTSTSYNPSTLAYSTPAYLTLNYLPSYGTNSLTLLQGYEVQQSIV
jgi:hypothetical protein